MPREPFGVAAAGSSVGREVLGGLTTFLTMAYILVVNPIILGAAGMPTDGVVVATALAAAFATLLMGLVANLPVALAPGMGMNAFFAFTLCRDHGVPWPTGLGLLVWVSAAFLVLTVGGIRERITRAVPRTLRFAAAGGIGLFITTIGLQQSGVVADDPATLVRLGDLRAPHTLLALGATALALGLLARGLSIAVFAAIVAAAAVGALSGLVPLGGGWVALPSGRLPGLEIDLLGALRADLLPLGVALLFFAIFDAMGTLYAVGAEAGLLDERGEFPALGRALVVDALGALAGALLGTSSVTCYVESATGASVGARTGLASVVTAACFVLALFCLPLVAAIAAGVRVGDAVFYPVTAPALIVVGVLMTRAVAEIAWDDVTEAVPAFLTIVVMPATFGISHGLAAGFVGYAGMKLASGRAREASPLVYAIAALFVWRYLWV